MRITLNRGDRGGNIKVHPARNRWQGWAAAGVGHALQKPGWQDRRRFLCQGISFLGIMSRSGKLAALQLTLDNIGRTTLG